MIDTDGPTFDQFRLVDDNSFPNVESTYSIGTGMVSSFDETLFPAYFQPMSRVSSKTGYLSAPQCPGNVSLVFIASVYTGFLLDYF